MISSRPSVTSSLPCSFAPQGLFCPGLMHLYLAFLFHMDYFGRTDSSLSGSFAPQGLFRPLGFISIWIFCSTGIISAVQIHLYLAFLLHRDYFSRPDSSLSCSFAPQGLLCPSLMHLYLAFLAYKWHTSFIFSAAFVQIPDIKKPETLKIQGFRLVEMTGIEPATSRLRTWRSPS